jgi:hypothetical protein
METWVILVAALVVVCLGLLVYWHPGSAALKWSILIVLAAGGVAGIAQFLT